MNKVIIKPRREIRRGNHHLQKKVVSYNNLEWLQMRSIANEDWQKGFKEWKEGYEDWEVGLTIQSAINEIERFGPPPEGCGSGSGNGFWFYITKSTEKGRTKIDVYVDLIHYTEDMDNHILKCGFERIGLTDYAYDGHGYKLTESAHWRMWLT